MIGIDLPATDEHGTPTTKMPNCPACGEDELGMMGRDFAFCYRCCAEIVRAPKAGETLQAVMGRKASGDDGRDVIEFDWF